MQTSIHPVELATLEAFKAPEGKVGSLEEGTAQEVDISSISGVTFHTFEFLENSNTPGRFLEQSVVVNVPAGAGFFVCLNTITGSFTTGDFQFLAERPLGQFSVSLGLRGNNFVCQVRLTDSNQDDPIFIRVRGLIVFFQ
jgi:hypothetical protein